MAPSFYAEVVMSMHVFCRLCQVRTFSADASRGVWAYRDSFTTNSKQSGNRTAKPCKISTSRAEVYAAA